MDGPLVCKGKSQPELPNARWIGSGSSVGQSPIDIAPRNKLNDMSDYIAADTLTNWFSLVLLVHNHNT